MSLSACVLIRSASFGAASILLPTCLAYQADAQSIGAAAATAETTTVRAGKVNFSIPSPATDLVEMGPDLRVLMETSAPGNLRLIAAFIPPDNLAKLPAESNMRFQNYALVEVPRAAEFRDVDQAVFKTVVDGAREQFSGGDLQLNMQTTMDRRLADLGVGAGKVTFDKPTQLGTIFAKPDATGFAMMVPMAANGQTGTMVGATILVRVRSRVLFAYLFSQYKDKGSVDWVLKTAGTWADAILKSNE
jgi:hypothetical protein